MISIDVLMFTKVWLIVLAIGHFLKAGAYLYEGVTSDDRDDIISGMSNLIVGLIDLTLGILLG